MKKVQWQLIPEDKLKEWAEALSFNVNDLDADYYRSYKDEVTKKEYFAAMILQRLHAGSYDTVGEVNEEDVGEKIDFDQLQQNHEDLHDFWIYAAPYWKGKDSLEESMASEKRELARRIQALNERLDWAYGTD